jgi:hypothetical protein
MVVSVIGNWLQKHWKNLGHAKLAIVNSARQADSHIIIGAKGKEHSPHDRHTAEEAN